MLEMNDNKQFGLHQGEKYIVESFVEKEVMGHNKQLCSRLLHMRQQATVSGKGLNRFRYSYL